MPRPGRGVNSQKGLECVGPVIASASFVVLFSYRKNKNPLAMQAQRVLCGCFGCVYGRPQAVFSNRRDGRIKAERRWG